MPFSTTPLAHSFLNGDGTPASGQVSAVLSARMSNGGTTIIPTTVTASLDSTGAVSLRVASNLDPGTVPADVTWQVTLRILGASEETFDVVVPVSSTAVDLASLFPSAQPVG